MTQVASSINLYHKYYFFNGLSIWGILHADRRTDNMRSFDKLLAQILQGTPVFELKRRKETRQFHLLWRITVILLDR